MQNLRDFKSIPGFEEYLISTDGEIYSKKTQKLLKPSSNKLTKQTYRVSLYLNGKGLKKLVHRLVALTYIPNPENKPTVNHKDGNIYNNSVSNLEWATYQEQIDHVMVNKLRQNSNHGSPIVRIYPDGSIKQYDSASKASQNENISKGCIQYWIRGGKPRDGSKWLYLADYQLKLNEINSEIWKPVTIEGVKTDYNISSLGRLRRNKTLFKGHIKAGYLLYSVTIRGKSKCHFAHRLVALTFLGDPSSPEMTVDHIDRNPLNNKLENLRWLTPSEQVKNTVRNYGQSVKEVVMYNKAGVELKRFRCADEAYRCIVGKKGRGGNINSVCQKKCDFAYGYRWAYVEDNYESNRTRINFNQPIVQVIADGSIVKYKNLKDVCLARNIVDGRHIRSWIRGDKNPRDKSKWYLEIDYNKLFEN